MLQRKEEINTNRPQKLIAGLQSLAGTQTDKHQFRGKVNISQAEGEEKVHGRKEP